MVVDTDSQVKGASSKPSYEVNMKQIAYLMSAVTNHTNLNVNKMVDVQDSNPIEMVSTHPLCLKDLRRIKRIWPVGDVGVQDIVGESASLPDKGIIFLLDPTLWAQIKVIGKI